MWRCEGLGLVWLGNGVLLITPTLLHIPYHSLILFGLTVDHWKEKGRIRCSVELLSLIPLGYSSRISNGIRS